MSDFEGEYYRRIVIKKKRKKNDRKVVGELRKNCEYIRRIKLVKLKEKLKEYWKNSRIVKNIYIYIVKEF